MNMTLQCTTLTEYMQAATKPHTYVSCDAYGDVTDCMSHINKHDTSSISGD